MKKYALAACMVMAFATWANLLTTNHLAGDTDFETTTEGLVGGQFSYGTHKQRTEITRQKDTPWFEIDRTTGYQSQSSLKLVNGATQCPTALFLPKGEWTYSCYLKSDMPQARAVFMVLKSNTPWVGKEGVLARRAKEYIAVGTEWKRYSLTFNSDGFYASCPYVGGWNRGHGTVWMDRIMIAPKQKTLPQWHSSVPYRMTMKFLNIQHGNIHPTGQPLTVRIRLVRFQNQPLPEPLRITVRDVKRQIQKDIRITPRFKDNLFQDDYPMPVDRNGWFMVEGKLPGMPTCTIAYVLVTQPEPSAQEIPPFVGLCGVQTMPEAGRMLGVGRADYLYAWRGTVNRNNRFEAPEAIEQLKKMKQMGYLNKVMMLPSPPEWMQPPEVLKEAAKYNINYVRMLPPKELVETKWRDFVRDFARQTRGLIDIYELSGEMDAMIGYNTYYKAKDGGKNMVGNYVTGESMEILSHCVKVAAQEILKVNPNARLSGIRPCDCDSRDGFIYSSEVFKRTGNVLNTFGVDCYPNPRWIGPDRPFAGTEKPLEFVYRKGMEAMGKYCKQADIFISEYGYFVDYRHILNEKYLSLQANRILRSFLKARALGFSGLDYFTVGSTKGGNEGKYYYFGLWWGDDLPLPGVASLATAARIVNNVTQAEDVKIKDELGVTVFHKADGHAVAALWSVDDKTKDIELTDHGYELMDAMGNPLPKRGSQGKLTLRLQAMPVIIWSRKPATDNFQALRQSCRTLKLRGDIPVDMIFRCETATDMKLYLKNLQLTKKVSGKLSWNLQGKTVEGIHFTIPAAETTVLRIPMPKVDQTIHTTLTFNGDYDDITRTYTAPKLIRVKRCQRELKLDGSLDSWQDIPCVTVSGSERIQPMDGTTYNGPQDVSANMYFAHDGTYFYFAADVTDDSHHNNSDVAWNGDGIQCAFDPETNHTTNSKTLDGDDSAFSLCLTKDGERFKVYLSPKRHEMAVGSTWKVIRDEARKQTLYQVKIPLKTIGANLKKDSIFGFNCCVFDDDSGAKADYWLYLSYGLAGGLNPALFAQCLLE